MREEGTFKFYADMIPAKVNPRRTREEAQGLQVPSVSGLESQQNKLVNGKKLKIDKSLNAHESKPTENEEFKLMHISPAEVTNAVID